MQRARLNLLFNLEIFNLSLILHSFTRLSRLVLAFHSARFNYSPLLSFAHCNTLLNRKKSFVYIVFLSLIHPFSLPLNRLPRSFHVHGSSPVSSSHFGSPEFISPRAFHLELGLFISRTLSDLRPLRECVK